VLGSRNHLPLSPLYCILLLISLFLILWFWGPIKPCPRGCPRPHPRTSPPVRPARGQSSAPSPGQRGRPLFSSLQVTRERNGVEFLFQKKTFILKYKQGSDHPSPFLPLCAFGGRPPVPSTCRCCCTTTGTPSRRRGEPLAPPPNRLAPGLWVRVRMKAGGRATRCFLV